MMNATTPLPFDVDDLLPRPITTPFYYSTRTNLLPFMSDTTLTVISPVIAYWVYSLVFHFVDSYDLYPQGRIHESEEVKRRNKASQAEVVWAVVVQHIIQSAAGYTWMMFEKPELRPSPADAMRSIAGPVARTVLLVLGESKGMPLLRAYGPQIVAWVYWWGLPIAQILLGMFIMDTWQYVLHRGMHVNKFLYRHLHSVHHRLYVPYSYGALYNHPLEGFLLDTLGGAVSHLSTGMSLRQAAFFFVVGTMKTVDDHCGYRIWWDPFQLFFANSADYHDIHHQHAGIKYNFSQPFFIHWDTILGTRMTRQQFAGRHKKVPEKEL